MRRISRWMATAAVLPLLAAACSSDGGSSTTTDAPAGTAAESPAAVDTDGEGGDDDESEAPETADTTSATDSPPEPPATPDTSTPDTATPDTATPGTSSPETMPDSTISVGDDCDEFEDLFDDFDMFDAVFFEEVLVVLEDLKQYTSTDLDADIDALIEAYAELGELIEEHGGDPMDVFMDPELEDEVDAILTADVNDAGARVEAFFESECPEAPDDTDPPESVDTSDPDVSYPPLENCDELEEAMDAIDLDVADIATLLQLTELFAMIGDGAPAEIGEDAELLIAGLLDIVQWLEDRGLESLDEVFEDEELNEEFDAEFERPETEAASDRIDDYLEDACPGIVF